MKQITTIISQNSDKIGIFSSFMCLVHCLSIPLLFSLQPALIGFVSDDLHFLEYIFLALSYLAVYFSSKNSSLRTKISFYIVLTLLTLGISFDQTIGWMKYAGYLGSFGLIIFHINRLRKQYRNKITSCPSTS